MNLSFATSLTLLAVCLQVNAQQRLPDIKERSYSGFRLIMDCGLRAPILFEQVVSKDNNKIRYKSGYVIDPALDSGCQQRSVGQYKENFGRVSYVRGQLVNPGSIDVTERMALEAFYMPNVVPMSSKLRDGAWKYTQDFQECERDVSDILVVGGAFYSNNSNDIFKVTHGIATPDYLWKVIFFGDKHAAWLFPNDTRPIYKNANNYLVPLSEIEKKAGYQIFGDKADRNYIVSERYLSVKRKPRCNLT